MVRITKIWKDSWISLNSQTNPFGPIHESALDLRVSDLLTDNLQWNKDRIEKLLPDFSKQIQSLRPSKEGAEDIFVWLPLDSWIYSKKSGYNSKAQTTAFLGPQATAIQPSPDLEFNWIKDIWSSKTAPKLKLFLWSCIQGALPLGSELQRRGMNSTVLCPRCKKEETAMHVFFQCSFAKEVWRLIPLKSPVHIADEAEFKALVVKSRENICLPPIGIRAPVLSWICWSLWLARNKLIF